MASTETPLSFDNILLRKNSSDLEVRNECNTEIQKVWPKVRSDIVVIQLLL